MSTTASSTRLSGELANRNQPRATVLFMQHGKALPPAVNDFIRRRLQEWLAADPSRRQSHLAAKLNVSPAHMTNVLKNGRGGGVSFETDVAAFLGIGVEELRRRAAAEWREPDGPQQQPVDRYRNRAAAVEFMRPWVSAEAIRQVQSISLQSPNDPDPKWWADQIENADRIVKMDLREPDRIARRDEAADRAGDAMEAATKPKGRKRAQ